MLLKLKINPDKLQLLHNFTTDRSTYLAGAAADSLRSTYVCVATNIFLIYVNNANKFIQNGKLIQFEHDTTICFTAESKKILDPNFCQFK